MRKISINKANLVGNGLEKNNLFDLNSSRNRDDCLVPFIELRKRFLLHGIELNTNDINQDGTVLFEIHLDVQREGDIRVPSYVLMYECPQIYPTNGLKKYQKKYRKIFTWRDDLIDGNKYIKLNFTNKIIINSQTGWQNRKKLCCLIAGNKTLSKKNPFDLYSERIKTIRWFETHAPDNFDLFGIGWDEPEATPGLIGKIKKKLGKNFYNKNKIYFPSYKGKVVSKVKTMEEYRFSICYENVRDLPGYITEKIWDCFFSGCVPIYWGASNVAEYIPKDCFIDRRQFINHEDMYDFLKSMKEKDYIGYQERIAEFLSSEKAKPFCADTFAETIVENIIKDIKNK